MPTRRLSSLLVTRTREFHLSMRFIVEAISEPIELPAASLPVVAIFVARPRSCCEYVIVPDARARPTLSS